MQQQKRAAMARFCCLDFLDVYHGMLPFFLLDCLNYKYKERGYGYNENHRR